MTSLIFAAAVGFAQLPGLLLRVLPNSLFRCGEQFAHPRQSAEWGFVRRLTQLLLKRLVCVLRIGLPHAELTTPLYPAIAFQVAG